MASFYVFMIVKLKKMKLEDVPSLWRGEVYTLLNGGNE